MIPKTIHYCWFGRGEMGEDVKNYISSWSRVMPDYEIIEWNEDNFDVSKARFCKEAYDRKQYAFVSDYARLDILFQFGGIYLDVDVEALKAFDKCLTHSCFFGYESENGGIATCVIGAEKENKFIQHLKNYYDNISFVNPDNSENKRPNTLIIEDIIINKYGVKPRGVEGEIGDIYLYDWHVFHPLSLISGKLSVTENTLAIHRHTLLWVPLKTRIIKFIRIHFFIPIFGERAYMMIERRRKR